MGVLIKDMEMPRGCYDCTLESICGRWAKHDAEWQKTNRDEDCPLVSVPPHGRLIDADALIDDVRRNSESYFADDFAHEWVDNAPTIIPSSEEGA